MILSRSGYLLPVAESFLINLSGIKMFADKNYAG